MHVRHKYFNTWKKDCGVKLWYGNLKNEEKKNKVVKQENPKINEYKRRKIYTCFSQVYHNYIRLTM